MFKLFFLTIQVIMIFGINHYCDLRAPEGKFITRFSAKMNVPNSPVDKPSGQVFLWPGIMASSGA